MRSECSFRAFYLYDVTPGYCLSHTHIMSRKGETTVTKLLIMRNISVLPCRVQTPAPKKRKKKYLKENSSGIKRESWYNGPQYQIHPIIYLCCQAAWGAGEGVGGVQRGEGENYNEGKGCEGESNKIWSVSPAELQHIQVKAHIDPCRAYIKHCV